MAKKVESIFKSWEEINLGLKEMSNLQVQKEKIEGAATVKINEIKTKSEEKAAVLANRIKEIEKNIERFAEQNKSEFIKSRSKKLTFWTISYRITKSVKLNNSPEECIKSLKALNLDFVLNIKETIDKDKCLDLDVKILSKAGISINTKDKLRIEPNVIKFVANQE